MGSNPTLVTQQSIVSTTSNIISRAAPSAGPNNSNNTGSQSSQERSLFLTFFFLTITFLFCHMPRILMNIHELHLNKNVVMCKEEYNRPYLQPAWVLYVSSVEKLLLILNSSINFVYYCICGKTFRQHMCKLFFGWTGWCVKVVKGIDPTTTAGTGETIIPDFESRLDGSKQRRVRHQLSNDFVSCSEMASEFEESLDYSSQLGRRSFNRNASCTLNKLEEDSNEDQQNQSSSHAESIIAVSPTAIPANDSTMALASSAAQLESILSPSHSSSKVSLGYYDISIMLASDEDSQVVMEKSISSPSSPIKKKRSQSLRKFSQMTVSISPTGSLNGQQSQPIFV